MSQENVELVRRVLEITQESVQRGDPGAGFDECVGEGILASNLSRIGGVRGGRGVAGMEDAVGREGFVESTLRWGEDFDDLVAEPEQIISADNDHVVVIARWSGTGKASGAPVEMHTGMVFTLESRRIVRVAHFIDPNHALKAAGISE
jgi:ketosteroid isomerase-like protein